MEKDTAELIVKIWAVLAWIGALFSFIGALALLFLGGVVGSMMGGMMGMGMMDEALGGAFVGALGIVLGILMLAMGVLYVFVGLGLWRRRNWARITTVVLSVLSLLSFPIGTILGILGIWFFGFDRTVRSLFDAPQPAAARSPAKAKTVAAKKKQ